MRETTIARNEQSNFAGSLISDRVGSLWTGLRTLAVDRRVTHEGTLTFFRGEFLLKQAGSLKLTESLF
jgi:hypothetical protein